MLSCGPLLISKLLSSSFPGLSSLHKLPTLRNVTLLLYYNNSTDLMLFIYLAFAVSPTVKRLALEAFGYMCEQFAQTVGDERDG